MKTLDLKKELKYLHAPSAKKAEIVNVPRLQFAMIDGVIEKGKEPGNSPAFAEATQALYSISYTLKFMFKKRPVDPVDYPVMFLEGLWITESRGYSTVERIVTPAELATGQPIAIPLQLVGAGADPGMGHRPRHRFLQRHRAGRRE